METIIKKLKRGKAAGLDGVTAEHLQYSHPLLPCVLAKLFNFMIKLGYVPHSFGESYTVPILKGGISSHGKSVTVDDFRGITISPVLSKVLEHCILARRARVNVKEAGVQTPGSTVFVVWNARGFDFWRTNRRDIFHVPLHLEPRPPGCRGLAPNE